MSIPLKGRVRHKRLHEWQYGICFQATSRAYSNVANIQRHFGIPSTLARNDTLPYSFTPFVIVASSLSPRIVFRDKGHKRRKKRKRDQQPWNICKCGRWKLAWRRWMLRRLKLHLTHRALMTFCVHQALRMLGPMQRALCRTSLQKDALQQRAMMAMLEAMPRQKRQRCRSELPRKNSRSICRHNELDLEVQALRKLHLPVPRRTCQ